MNETLIDSIEALHRAIVSLNLNPKDHIFRGVTKRTYQLLPSVGRLNFYRAKPGENPKKWLLDEERSMFEKFRQRAVPYLEVNRPADLWDWLALAQHHGLPTRLLDWTSNPLVAAYFAVEDDTSSEDSLIYVTKLTKEMEIEVEKKPDPLKVHEIGKKLLEESGRKIITASGLTDAAQKVVAAAQGAA